MSKEYKLKKGSLGLWYVVFFVVAAASPLTGVVGALPVAFMAGNGAGVAGTFIIAGALLLIFSFGLVAMSRHVVNAGAFYSYIAQGLGLTCGLAGFNVALLAYAAMQLSCSAMFGFFTELFVTRHFGSSLPWWAYAALMQMVVIGLGIAKVEIGGKVLGVLMLLEIAIVLLMDAVFMARPVTWEFSSFQPSTVLNGNFGIAMVFAICSFIGFEATAIYAEECREPKKVVAKATFTAVILITVFYALTAWVLVQYTGASQIAAVAAKDPGVYVYSVAEQLLGGWAVEVISILLITSLFAATQAFHNSLSRYLFTISRDGLLWSKLAKTHAVYKTPYIASIVQGIFMIVALVTFGLFKLDPMINIFAWASVLFAGQFQQDLNVLIEKSPELGREFGRRIQALAQGRDIESYGKAILVGMNSEYEHGNAFLTNPAANPVREAIGGGKSWVPSTGKRGVAGTIIDVPLAHKDALYVRSHYDTFSLSFNDAPNSDEIIVIWAFATRGRLHARLGGLKASEIKGEDGLN